MTETIARLVVHSGRYINQTFELTNIQTTVGRSPESDITFTDPEISRKHSQLTRQLDGSYTLADLGSTNGTFLNGERLTHAVNVSHGDMINFGDAIEVEFMVETAVPANTDHEDTAPGLVYVPASDFEDTPSVAQPAPVIPQNSVPLVPEEPDESAYEPVASNPRRTLILGCLGVLMLLIACIATVFILDAYDQGRLLYCGALRPLFEAILGPFNFDPICP